MDQLGFNSGQIAIVILCFSGGELGGKLLIAVTGDRLPFPHLYLLVASCLGGAVVLGILTLAESVLALALTAAGEM